jgi:hypothetical protein
VKIGFSYSTTKLSGKLTKFFTGSYAYHVFLLDEASDLMYDQHLILRRRIWPHYGDNANIKLVESPVPISREYMEHLLSTSVDAYGVLDYILFALRPIYHLFGKSTRNAGGVICSELVYNVLKANGWGHTFDEVPSPADLERVLLESTP